MKDNGKKAGITVLVVEPLKEPYVKTISSGLKSLQAEVGGNIEEIFPFDDASAVILNGDGKLKGLMPNRGLYDCEGRLCDVIAGTFLVLGTAGEDFCSLSKEQIAEYMERYKVPERFSYRNGAVRVIPVPAGGNTKTGKHMGKSPAGATTQDRKAGKGYRADGVR